MHKTNSNNALCPSESVVTPYILPPYLHYLHVHMVCCSCFASRVLYRHTYVIVTRNTQSNTCSFLGST